MSARAVAASLALLLLAGSSATPAQGQDARLVDQITQLVSSQRGIRIYDWVNFIIKDRQVTLTGTVTTRTLKRGIARSIRKLEAVDSVVNELELFSSSGDDIGIRINAYWRIYGHPEIRRLASPQSEFRQRLRRSPTDTQRVLLQPIHIVVEDGHLTLEGELEQQREKWVAEEQAYAVLGVRSVTNNIVVTGTDTEELQPIDFENDPWWRDSQSLEEPVLRVENPAGAVRVKVVNTERVRLRRTSRSRPVQAGDTTTTRLGRKTRIRASPTDGALVDLEVDLPYGHRLEVETADGPISVTGLIRRADLKTSFGRVELAIPWKSVRFAAALRRKPAHVDIPEHLRASMGSPGEPPVESAWQVDDLRDQRRSLYGTIRLEGVRPDALVLRETRDPRGLADQDALAGQRNAQHHVEATVSHAYEPSRRRRAAGWRHAPPKRLTRWSDSTPTSDWCSFRPPWWMNRTGQFRDWGERTSRCSRTESSRRSGSCRTSIPSST